MGQQHIFDGLVANSTDFLDQVARHIGRGRGIADQDVFVANDHTRVRVAFGGIRPTMRAELLKLDLLVGQVGLAGEGFGGHWVLLTLAFPKNWIVGGFVLLLLLLFALANCVCISLWAFAPANQERSEEPTCLPPTR